MSWFNAHRERRERGEQGFTLIELLLVIVILGVLSAVVVISVRGVSDRGEESACGATQTAVLTANEAYYAQNGTAPGSTDELVPDYLAEGAGAHVTGNTVSGKGWSFDFNPADGTISNATGCDGSGGGGGGTTTTTPDGGGGGTTTTSTTTTSTTTTTVPPVCQVSNLQPTTVTRESDNDLPPFSFTATVSPACSGTMTVHVTRPGTDIDVALGVPVSSSQRDNWSTGSFSGTVSGGGLATPVNFTFTVQDPPCTVTAVTPNSSGRFGTFLAIGSFDINTSNCGGVDLRLHVNGRTVDENNGSGPDFVLGTSFRSNWSAGTYTITFTRTNGPGAGSAIPTSNTETLVVS